MADGARVINSPRHAPLIQRSRTRRRRYAIQIMHTDRGQITRTQDSGLTQHGIHHPSLPRSPSLAHSQGTSNESLEPVAREPIPPARMLSLQHQIHSLNLSTLMHTAADPLISLLGNLCTQQVAIHHSPCGKWETDDKPGPGFVFPCEIWQYLPSGVARVRHISVGITPFRRITLRAH